ncbi:MAG: phenylacetate-CoA oxygenase/reductase subunit PaaK [Saprospiraceae bacterium]|nr:phenylacetate-CoA oxygenase/reductase subunit PaaK [Saprospiraceae bacterium]
MKFYPLKVKDIRIETSDCVSIAFDIPPQYKEVFAFQQGQYLTLKTVINGEEIRRSYSLCTAPAEGDVRVAIKQVTDGKFSTFANQKLRKGDTLDVMPPMGHFFTPLSQTHQKSYVFFAAGSGITPIISNIKAILTTEPQSICTLIYGNQRVSTIIFKEEIEALKNKHLGRFQVFNVLSREKTESDLLHGRLDKNKIAHFLDKIPSILRGDEFFACGPVDMIEAVKETLFAKEIDEKRLHFELFNAPKTSPKKEVLAKTVNSHAQIKLDGLTIDVPIDKGQNILDAAQMVGADLPFACKGGVCCTCRAKLIAGEVEMQANYALTKEEVAQGFILTCQALPKTEKIVVDFDIK